MDLSDAPSSSDVEDRRGMGATGGLVAGGGGIIILILGLIFGIDTNKLGLTGGGGGARHAAPPADNYKEFASKVLGTLEKTWEKQFTDPHNDYRGAEYANPKMVLFSDAVNTGCGHAPSSVGPFYCPRDSVIYLDPTFFDLLGGQLHGSAAEFSQAYVIAHEFGHHVQNLLGYSGLVDSKRGTKLENQYSVRLELQADYLAGVWANQGQKDFHFIRQGDIESAITSAKAIGDDVLQKRSGGFVQPEKFTHGTSDQRVKAFTAGYKTGDATREKLDKFFSVPIDSRGQLDDSLFR
jgi:predicted metalloprotease